MKTTQYVYIHRLRHEIQHLTHYRGLFMLGFVSQPIGVNLVCTIIRFDLLLCSTNFMKIKKINR